jgi:hypothetical protein
VPLVDADGETLEESIDRLWQIEKSLGIARGTRVELQQLQHDHINAVKARCNNGIGGKEWPSVITETTVVAVRVLG